MWKPIFPIKYVEFDEVELSYCKESSKPTLLVKNTTTPDFTPYLWKFVDDEAV